MKAAFVWCSNNARPVRRYAILAAIGAAFASRGASAQVVSADLNSALFVEPSASSELLVVNPSANFTIAPSEALRLNLAYEADIVSGATESVKAGPLSNVDVVSSATHFSDTRHVVRGGLEVVREDTRLAAAYSYGTEADYRSNAITVSAGTQFLQKNTEIELAYARGFDQVCTSAYATTLAPSARSRLDSSDGCFSDAENRARRDIDLDTLQIGWTQTWTPVLSTQLVLTAALQHGFLGNPYREVVIGAAGDRALENHPENRARVAAALRTRYFIRSLNAAVGLGVRGYRDTWDVLSQTLEVDGEKYLTPWLRVLARARFYNQAGALFWSDDYTGGEPEYGPRGQYWSGDRELSPFRSYLVGGRVLIGGRGDPTRRLFGVFSSASASGGLDALKTDLRNFSWAGENPDDTVALIANLSLNVAF